MIGKGLFTKQNIKKGELVWTIQKENHEFIESLEDAQSKFHDEKSFLRFLEVSVGHSAHPGKVMFAFDQGQYFNHSNMPNCGELVGRNPFNLYALRDIHAGEELTESYSNYIFPTW